LKVLYPGYSAGVSVGVMDEYAHQLSPDPMELESQIMSYNMPDDTLDVLLITQSSRSSLSASTGVNVSSVTSQSKTGIPNLPSKQVNRPLSLGVFN
jgi:hypothetical protein